MKNRMKDEKIIISVNGSVSMEEGKDSVIAYVWFTISKNNNKVYNTEKFLFKASNRVRIIYINGNNRQ